MFITYIESTKPITQPCSQVTFEQLMQGIMPEAPILNQVPRAYFNRTIKVDEDNLTPDFINESARKLTDFYRQFGNELNFYRELNMREFYTHFEIPEASGGTRPIDAPCSQLKDVLANIKNFLEFKAGLHAHTAAYAYVPYRCAKDAVERHQKTGHKFYMKIDLHNFFGSCTEAFIKEQLIKTPFFHFMTQPTIDAVIHLACLNGVLPQGSPLSPWLTNQIMLDFDFQMTQFCREHNITYTRYADDMLFSANFNPKQIVLQKLNELLSNTPLRVNENKTRVSTINGKNFNLGIIVNKDNQLSVGHKRKEIFRAQLTDYCNKHDQYSVHQAQELLGNYTYLAGVETEYFQNLLTKYSNKFSIDILATLKEKIKNN